jgi:hypothetical protein
MINAYRALVGYGLLILFTRLYFYTGRFFRKFFDKQITGPLATEGPKVI